MDAIGRSVSISLGALIVDPLFAPWRMDFIERHDESKGCVFCKIPQESDSKKMLVIHRGRFCFVVLNRFPYSHGHLMVIPFRHEKDWTKLSADELNELNQLTQQALKALQAAFEPQGFNLGVNLGRAAGAGIEAHVHQHVVPRWNGDFNFMPLIGEVKMISEHLDKTYDRLKEAWTAL